MKHLVTKRHHLFIYELAFDSLVICEITLVRIAVTYPLEYIFCIQTSSTPRRVLSSYVDSGSQTRVGNLRNICPRNLDELSIDVFATWRMNHTSLTFILEITCNMSTFTNCVIVVRYNASFSIKNRSIQGLIERHFILRYLSQYTCWRYDGQNENEP